MAVIDHGLDSIRKSTVQVKKGDGSEYQIRTVIGDGANLDAFSRLRVSSPVSLFDSQSEYNRKLLQFYEKTSGAGALTHVPDEAVVELSIGTADGDLAIRQSKRYVRYQPSKSQLIFATFAFGSTQTNSIKRIGYYDDKNGVFLEDHGGVYSFVLRSSTTGTPVERRIPRDEWSLDQLDGYDLTKASIFTTDIEWLGVGRVRVGFVIAGMIVYCHEFLNSGVHETTYMTTANLPIRYEIKNDGGNASSDSFKSICCAVSSEGGYETERGIPFSIGLTSPKSVSTTFLPVLSIRPRPLFNTVTNRMELIRPRFSIGSISNNIIFKVVYNATLTTPSWTAIDDESAVEYDTSSTSFTGGLDIDFGYGFGGSLPQSSNHIEEDLLSRLPFSNDIDGNPATTITIVARVATGNPANVYAAMKWLEIY